MGDWNDWNALVNGYWSPGLPLLSSVILRFLNQIGFMIL
jgi:hypothetical protein